MKARTLALSLETPRDFGFGATVRSHGWYDLAPFRHDEAAGTLETAVALASGAASIHITSADPRRPGAPLEVRVRGALPRREAEALVRTMLQLDSDLAPLHAALEKDRERASFAWVRTLGAGRLLRAPRAFEDLVKILCTTNCTWAGTRAMVAGLVSFGPEAPGGLRAFPSPATLAALDEATLREKARMGYRAASLLALARAGLAGDLSCEALRGPGLDTDALRDKLLALQGFGPYAADQALRLAGRYDRPALDSAMRATWRRLHPRSRAGSDKAICALYLRRFGAFAGLAMWLELTREWHA